MYVEETLSFAVDVPTVMLAITTAAQLCVMTRCVLSHQKTMTVSRLVLTLTVLEFVEVTELKTNVGCVTVGVLHVTRVTPETIVPSAKTARWTAPESAMVQGN